MRLIKAARVILFGAPGVGKGTQSERLLSRFPQLNTISTGDLLRHNVKNRTPLGIKVESTMKSGGLVADDLMLRLISNELFTRGWLKGQGPPSVMMLASEAITSEHSAYRQPPIDSFVASPFHHDEGMPPRVSDDPAASFILDGFPRTAPQAGNLDKIVPINLVVSIKTPLSVIIKRIAGRWVHEPSGRVYNTSFNAPRVPGRDDITGEPLIQRADDAEDVYRTRFRKFQETSEPVLEHYAKKGVLVEVEGMSSDEISPKLYAEFEKRFVQ
ncbi:P-loop containing nucleoside triphosphate hydrolase protein [Dactylonectria estremocensis]|uniref:GTP:AMP phosphotransferase, mitochondrial n=1 Tax=Dactylonectria estremocensis TaxID=1079267 RepID=A0A9P9JCT9_9HYPO|nr:P-loop containing nucleoside triphosphate hydrolase protein [Dactylonectria estremocensis]